MAEPVDPKPPAPGDDVEREPAGWWMLPIIALAVVFIFFFAIPLLLRLVRQ